MRREVYILYREFSSNINVLSSSVANVDEKEERLISRWETFWIYFLIGVMPLLLLFIFENGSWKSFLFSSPIIFLMVVLAYRDVKIIEKYLKKPTKIYTIRGELFFDENSFNFMLDSLSLELSSNWKKILKKQYKESEKVEIIALAHFYEPFRKNNIHRIQPLSIKSLDSNNLNMNHKDIPTVRSFLMPLLLFLGSLFMVLLMHFDKFIPYSYYGITTYNDESYFYSVEGMLEESLKKHQYLESVGLSIPILEPTHYSFRSYRATYKEIETDNTKLFFPKNIEETIVNYPRVSEETLKLIERFKIIKKRVKGLRRCDFLKKDVFYFDYCLKEVMLDIKEKSDIFEPFDSYRRFLEEKSFKYFDAFREEILIKLNDELFRSYETLKSLREEGVYYESESLGGNQRTFSENIEYIDYMFNYLKLFPRGEVIAGILIEKENAIWRVKEDNYYYLPYTIFLSFFWFFCIGVMLYSFFIFMTRID